MLSIRQSLKIRNFKNYQSLPCGYAINIFKHSSTHTSKVQIGDIWKTKTEGRKINIPQKYCEFLRDFFFRKNVLTNKFV